MGTPGHTWPRTCGRSPCPSCPCDEHGIEPQHCIACSGVALASQSSAYTPINSAAIASKMGLPIRMRNHSTSYLRLAQGVNDHGLLGLLESQGGRTSQSRANGLV